MREVPLNLENLQQLDLGKIGAAFNKELEHVVADCLDRPQDVKTRKVTITFLLAPVPDMDSLSHQINCDHIDVGCEITSSVPKRRTRVYSMKPKTDNTVTFHPDVPADPDASTLYEDVETPAPQN